MRKRVLGMVLAGGRGDRLQPLTRHRTKPAVPFGGLYRIIDFVLSNFVNSGVKSIYVLTQFKSQSLSEHLQRAWMGTNLWPGHFIVPVPAQMQTAGAVWYQGTADAIFQNLNLIQEAKPDLVCIFGSDHIYRMDLAQMLRLHNGNEADVSIASIPVTREEGRRFGVLETDSDLRIQGFHEKVDDPPAIPGDPSRCLASMGNYVFGREVLEEVLLRDAEQPGSSHDFGKDILPTMVEEGRRVFAYDFATNLVPGIEASTATGATSGRWRRTTTPRWISRHRCRNSTFPTNNGRCIETPSVVRRPACSAAAARTPGSSGPSRARAISFSAAT